MDPKTTRNIVKIQIVAGIEGTDPGAGGIIWVADDAIVDDLIVPRVSCY